jgi:hypothetical protein
VSHHKKASRTPIRCGGPRKARPRPLEAYQEAIHPETLRRIVRATIDQHVDRDRLARLQMVEKEERMLEIFAVQASGRDR